MPIIHMMGPNAIGKTTAATRWSEKYGSRIAVVLADIQMEVVGDVKTKVRGWKGEQSEKKALVEAIRTQYPVVLCESARTTTTTTYALPEEPVIILTCSPEAMDRNMKARCDRKGKTFREDYWKLDKLAYESSRRYLTFAKKNLDPRQIKHFVIEDYATDWAAVDEYFFSLFRRLWNARNKP